MEHRPQVADDKVGQMMSSGWENVLLPLDLAATVIRKTRTLADRVYSIIQMKQSPIIVRSTLNYRERTIIRQLGPYLQDKDLTVYDIGAHIGDFSRMFAKLENVANVVSFEPIPDVFAQTQRMLSSYSQVRCFNVALGDEPGVVKFHLNDSSSSSSVLPMAELHKKLFPFTERESVIEVEIFRLDDMVAHHGLPAPDIVKIDVQGFEDRVIKGAVETLRSAKYCIVETSLMSLYEGAPDFEQVYSLMRSLEFTVRGFSGDTPAADGMQVQVDVVFGRQ